MLEHILLFHLRLRSLLPPLLPRDHASFTRNHNLVLDPFRLEPLLLEEVDLFEMAWAILIWLAEYARATLVALLRGQALIDSPYLSLLLPAHEQH